VLDAKQLLAAFENPTFIDPDGEKTVGRPLSHVQYQQVLRDLRAAGTDVQKTEDVLREALTNMGLPAEKILQLPDPLYWKAIEDFFRCCRGEPPTPAAAAPSTTGPSSATPLTPA